MKTALALITALVLSTAPPAVAQWLPPPVQVEHPNPGPPIDTWTPYFAALVAQADATGDWTVATDAALGHYNDEFIVVEFGWGTERIPVYALVRTDILVRMVDEMERRLLEQAGWSSANWYADMKADYTTHIRNIKHNLARRWPPLDPWPWPADLS